MLLFKIRRQLVAFILGANTATLLGGVAAYVCISYILLKICGETELIAPDVFLYWLVVTASTVGYGDYSPTTLPGRLITALFIIPTGLSLFALFFGKIGFYLSDVIQRGKKGRRMTRVKDHCVIIGWHGPRTLRLIHLLLAKDNVNKERIVLCHDQEMENPLPSKIDFSCVDSFTDTTSMKRAAIDKAARIIIDTQEDDITLATALYCHQQNNTAHITVFFEDESHGELIRSYCPAVEVVPSVSVEMMARTATDPGSASLHKNLLDPTLDASQFSIAFSMEQETPFSEILRLFRSKHQAIPIAVKRQQDTDVDINPPDELSISKGDIIYYIADRRLKEL